MHDLVVRERHGHVAVDAQQHVAYTDTGRMRRAAVRHQSDAANKTRMNIMVGIDCTVSAHACWRQTRAGH